MRLLSFLLLTLICHNTNGQKVLPCTCKGFVDTSYKGTIYLQGSPKGKTTNSIMYSQTKGNYLLFEIDQVADSFFFVRMKHAITGNAYQGWIKKSKYLNTLIKSNDPELTLFYEASSTSKVRSKTPNTPYSLFQISNCTQNWIYIRKIKPGSKPEGWLHSKDQCPDPAAICN